MADNPEAVAAANPPVAPIPQPQQPQPSSLYDGLRVRLAPFVAATDAALGGGLPLSQEIVSGAHAANTVVNQAYQELKDTTLDPKKRLDFLTGLVQPGSGAGDEGAAALEGLYKGLRVRPASEIMVQPETTSRATPTGETGSLPPEVHANLEKQAGRELSDDEAVALDRANLERGMVTAPDNSSAVREQKRSELEKPRVYKDSSDSEQPITVHRGGAEGKSGRFGTTFYAENPEYAKEYLNAPDRKLITKQIKPQKPLDINAPEGSKIAAQALAESTGVKEHLDEIPELAEQLRRDGTSYIDAKTAAKLKQQGYDFVTQKNDPFSGATTGRIWIDLADAGKTPQQAIENAGMKYKGEVVPGSGVHQFEHPDHPGKTAAMKEKDITPESVKTHMADVLRKFEEGKKLGK